MDCLTVPQILRWNDNVMLFAVIFAHKWGKLIKPQKTLAAKIPLSVTKSIFQRPLIRKVFQEELWKQKKIS